MTSLVEEARMFAESAHGGQSYGDRPYLVHLDAVAEILIPYGELAQVIGYLHDVVEDTDRGIEAIRRQFGEHVSDCVALVTDAPAPTRRDRKALTHARLGRVGESHELALVVKAADRLANLRESSRFRKGSKLEMYREEHPAFREAVYREGLCEDLWAEIEQIIDATRGLSDR